MTRKSSEEGLEQDFNSLDAQREACEAYVASQRHEGWTLLPARYDDGGYSGGGMARPALQQLLAEVAAGRVDVIVVYKVDRLSRSLADFARMVELFDKHQVSFVSVTQSFNTTSSMGRLTLNVLLSFAQFEREVTGERIRDKIRAAKAKGLWMGGNPPLGYDVVDKKLVANAAEAEQVRALFEAYLASGSIAAFLAAVERAGVRAKRRHRRSGAVIGGGRLSRGALYAMLANPVYIGKLVHKGDVHEGVHAAIVDGDLFAAVQAKRSAARAPLQPRCRVVAASLLSGIIVDDQRRPMTPCHASKGNRRYRYYATHTDHVGEGAPARRVPAHDLEAAVSERLISWLMSPYALPRTLDALAADCAAVPTSAAADAERQRNAVADRLRGGSIDERRELLRALVDRVTVETAAVSLLLKTGTAPLHLAESVQLTAPVMTVRSGKALRLVVPPADADPRRIDAALLQLVADAFAVREALAAGAPVAAVADKRRCSPAWVRRLARIGWLAPDIIDTILNGRQPPALSRRSLSLAPLPLDWPGQRRVLGFEAAVDARAPATPTA